MVDDALKAHLLDCNAVWMFIIESLDTIFILAVPKLALATVLICIWLSVWMRNLYTSFCANKVEVKVCKYSNASSQIAIYGWLWSLVQICFGLMLKLKHNWHSLFPKILELRIWPPSIFLYHGIICRKKCSLNSTWLEIHEWIRYC